MRNIALATIAFFLSATAINAVVAKPGVIDALQPDGTTVTIRMEGGPRGHAVYNLDDQLMMTDRNGFYVVADEEFKSQVEIRNASRSISMLEAPGLMTNPFPAMGEQKSIVVLVEYSDLGFSIDNPKDFYEEMLNGENFSAYGTQASVRKYFDENSNGQFDLSFDIYGPITLPREMAYYGGNDYWGNDTRAYEMVIDACNILHDQYGVDFRDYDKNNDSYVDNVYIFYAGYGEADGGGPNTVWPHSWELEAVRKFIAIDGVRINHYACSNELQYNPYGEDLPDGIGTFCHEFCHVMGIPDLYSTISSGSFTPGSWSLLDVGSYNNNSRTPPHLSAFERYSLGWLTPRKIVEPGIYTIEPIGDSNDAIIIPADNENEYFLLENRQLKNWDGFIPGHGMLVWHIDFDQSIWDNNTVNVDARHQRVDIVEADGIPSNWTRDGDAFPGIYEKTEFSSTSLPALEAWSGKSLNIDLKDIAETKDGNIRFNAIVDGRSSSLSSVASDETTGTVRYFNLKGVEISNPQPGEVLIEKSGGVARKIIF